MSDKVRRVGILMEGTDQEPVAHENLTTFIAAFRALGWTAGQNLHLDIRWAGKDGANFEGGASELLALGPDALVAATSPAVAALRKRTKTVPIVFVIVTDPVGQGFVYLKTARSIGVTVPANVLALADDVAE